MKGLFLLFFFSFYTALATGPDRLLVYAPTFSEKNLSQLQDTFDPIDGIKYLGACYESHVVEFQVDRALHPTDSTFVATMKKYGWNEFEIKSDVAVEQYKSQCPTYKERR